MEDDDPNEDTNLMQSEPKKNCNSSSQQECSSSAEGEPKEDSNKIDQMTAQLSKLMQQLESKDDMISELQEHILSLETDWTKDWNSINKKRKFSNSRPDEDEEDEIQKLKEENLQLRKRIDELITHKESNTESSNQNILSEPKSIKQNRNDTPMDEILKTIEEKMNKGFNNIQSNVEKMINEKLNGSNLLEQPNNNQRTYANAVGENRSANISDLRSLMLANKNEEIEEEKDRNSRAKNIIIHGKYEVGVADDKHFAENLIKELQIGAPKIDKIERIGQEKEQANGTTQKRPIKLVLKSEEDKEKVLNNLRHLKGKTLYKSISITADYTYSERLLISDFREKANIKNDLENDKEKYIWRVRGTPKNGLFLKRLTKVN